MTISWFTLTYTTTQLASGLWAQIRSEFTAPIITYSSHELCLRAELPVCRSADHHLSAGFGFYLDLNESVLIQKLILRSYEEAVWNKVSAVVLMYRAWGIIQRTDRFDEFRSQQADPQSCRLPGETSSGDRKPSSLLIDLIWTGSMYQSTLIKINTQTHVESVFWSISLSNSRLINYTMTQWKVTEYFYSLLESLIQPSEGNPSLFTSLQLYLLH